MALSSPVIDMLAPDGIKVGFEDLLACQAACAGCTLTHEERTRGGLWPQHIADEAGRVAVREVAMRAALPGVREADLIGIQLFQGNHLLLAPDDIHTLIDNLAGIAGTRSDVILSTSPVGNRRLIERGLAALADARARTGLAVDTALILSDHRDYRPDIAAGIAENTRAIRTYFDLTDAVLPIAADPARLPTPNALQRRMEEEGFETLALALQPTRINAAAFAAHWPALIAWMRDVLSAWQKRGGYDLMLYKNAGRTLIQAEAAEPGEIVAALRRRLRNQVFIDHHGYLHFMQEGIGGDDMPLSGRYGFTALGPAGANNVETRLDEGATTMARRIWRSFLTDPACRDCPHKGGCALSGAGQMKQALGDAVRDETCPLGIRGLMDDLKAISQENANAA